MRLKKDRYRELMIEKGLTADMVIVKSGLSKREVEWALRGNQLRLNAIEALAFVVGADVQDIATVDPNMENENVIEFYTNSDTAMVTFHQQKHKSRIQKLATQRPDEVEIVSNDGKFLVAKVPATWIKISPPAVQDLSDERRAELSERMRALNSERLRSDTV